MAKDKATYAKLLDEVCEDCCPADTYCTIKEMLLSSHADPRFLFQLKCVEKFKYEVSKELGEDVEWDGAHIMWVLGRYAAAFAQCYQEDAHIKDVYAATLAAVKDKVPSKELHQMAIDYLTPKAGSEPAPPETSTK